MSAAPQFITDTEGNRVAVVIDLATYRQLLEALEDLEDIRAAEEARVALAAGDEEAIPFEQAMAEIDADHV